MRVRRPANNASSSVWNSGVATEVATVLLHRLHVVERQFRILPRKRPADVLDDPGGVVGPDHERRSGEINPCVYGTK